MTATTLLREIWGQNAAGKNAVPVDRFLSRALAGLPKSAQRQRLSDDVFAAHRLAVFALFAEKVLRERVTALESALEGFQRAFPGPVAVTKALAKRSAPETVMTWVRARTGQGGSPEVRRVLERLKKHLPVSLLGQMIWNGLPPWCLDSLKSRTTLSAWSLAQTLTFLDAQSTPAPLWIRLASDVRAPEVWTEFEKHKFEVKPAAHDALAWKVAGGLSLYEFATFKAGLFEIQDYASQQIGNAVESKAGQMVWDACAGAGGKSLQLAANQGPKGAIWASDVSGKKLKALKLRARRAGFSNIRIFPWNGEEAPKLSKEVALRGGFHWVLVDAPCSASGTWRRNPWERFRFGGQASHEFKTLRALQLKLLLNAAAAVRPGGFLVYGTCSWHPSENEDVAEEFLQTHNDFRLHRQKLHGCPEEDADTTFTAVFVRNPKPE